ncbi:YmaF family protein [Sporolactobacillus putidus]|uniref:YmaF family protein n=1 Tax=Sporolactobacillus putidus TaxID=492735 RepID=UPI001663A69F|nr:YmaF family protein [Sporolactobacillus putidus]
MEIPVSGFMYHSDDSNPLHSHQLFITSWDGRPVHVHEFRGVTSFDVGHAHKYAGTTEPAPSGVPHTHRYFTFTSVDDGHRHEIRGVTGPAIPLPGGGHYHEFRGTTTVSGATPHTHKYSGKTSPEVQ